MPVVGYAVSNSNVTACMYYCIVLHLKIAFSKWFIIVCIVLCIMYLICICVSVLPQLVDNWSMNGGPIEGYAYVSDCVLVSSIGLFILIVLFINLIFFYTMCSTIYGSSIPLIVIAMTSVIGQHTAWYGYILEFFLMYHS